MVMWMTAVGWAVVRTIRGGSIMAFSLGASGRGGWMAA
jgi:hypothetical protein